MYLIPVPRAKQYLPFFQRSGKMQAVVEYVLSGHRLKLLIPKEGVCIVFAPSGVKTPSRAQPASGGKPATAAEPYGRALLLHPCKGTPTTLGSQFFKH
jgi:hypothetical protein